MTRKEEAVQSLGLGLENVGMFRSQAGNRRGQQESSCFIFFFFLCSEVEM